MTNYRIDAEEEALFPSNSNAYAIYYVHSPSAFSRANSTETPIHNDSLHHSPIRSETLVGNPSKASLEATVLALSRYSSSRGSTSSFLPEKKIPYEDHGGGDVAAFAIEEFKRYEGSIAARARNVRPEDEDEDCCYESGGGRWWRWLTFSYSSSCGWKVLQLTWRFLLSLVVALIVFYSLTKPAAPELFIKVAGMPQFELSEGVDGSGVNTKMLTCNCTLKLVIDNKSKLFGLRIPSPTMQMSFGYLPFALTRGPELQAAAHGLTKFTLFVGTRNKPMYGAGRSMQDLLESKNGLPLITQVTLRSSFRVVWGLINPKYHHHVECFILLRRGYDKKYKTHNYISSCKLTL